MMGDSVQHFKQLVEVIFYVLMSIRDGSDSKSASNFVKIWKMCGGDPGND
jgi:hypothetical protein